MGKVSIIIPSRNEIYLQKTVHDLLDKARGDVEVIAILDGYWPSPPLADDIRLIQLHRGRAVGMRAAINAGAGIARGDYLMKCDAHCMFAEGYDEVLKANCDGDWIVIPRRKRLDPVAWAIKDVGKPDVDYEYLSCPWTNKSGFTMHGTIWNERANLRNFTDFPVDENMSFQGSCWFMAARHFRDFLGEMDECGYGTFTQEAQEIGIKTWLGGGKIMTNKNTWYAHWHKDAGRGYSQDRREVAAGQDFSARYWTENRWEGRIHDFDWMIDHFWPVPTWPDDWKEKYYD